MSGPMSQPVYVRVAPAGGFPEIGPQPKRVVVIAEAQCSANWQALASEWLVRSGCLYMIACGPDCSSWDDSVDLANVERFTRSNARCSFTSRTRTGRASC
jgi:hypothetical protein